MLFKRYHGLGMDALVTVCSSNTNVVIGHECSGNLMLFELEPYYRSGMDALVTACSSNTNIMMVWAWMLWSPYALSFLVFVMVLLLDFARFLF